MSARVVQQWRGIGGNGETRHVCFIYEGGHWQHKTWILSDRWADVVVTATDQDRNMTTLPDGVTRAQFETAWEHAKDYPKDET